MRILVKYVLPLLIVLAAVAVSAAIVLSKPEPEKRVPEVQLPVVRVHVVELQDMQMTIHSQGTVVPRTESALIPEIAGRIVEVSAHFEPGGFFETGDVLLRIDPYDYHRALVEAQARVTQAELRLAQEAAETEVARREWQELGQGAASPLTLREPQLADARAAVDAAQAAVERARRDLARTEIRAPFAGRVRTKQADVGQYVQRGSRLATLYAVDFAEVRLPLADDQLEFVDLPLSYRGERSNGPGPQVTLSADFAGGHHSWQGRIVRTEGEIDPGTRMLHGVARVRDPYGRGVPGRPPLAAGMFVEAEIVGRTYEAVASIPRAALLEGDKVLVVDDDDRLRFRPVEVLRRTREDAVISSGLRRGERICVSALAAATDGMQVRVIGVQDAA